MKFNQFIYNEETRIHTLGKQIIPSVTQVLAPMYDYSKVPAKTLSYKRDLGIAFHSAISLYLQNDLDDSSVDPQLVRPMLAFRVWWERENQEKNYKGGLITETPNYHEKLKYCGKPDMVVTSTIYDWKLRPYNKLTDPLQMAAYKELNTNVTDLIIVCFDLDGNYKVHRAFNTQAWPVFRKMLDRWKTEQKFNLLLTQWKGAVE